MSENDPNAYQPIPLPKGPDYSEDEMRARADDFYKLMKKRRTVRDYDDRPVPREVIEKAILTAGTAPNGANRQPWHFAVLAPGTKRTEIREAAEVEERDFYLGGKASDEWLEALRPYGTDESKPFLEHAPWLIVVFAERHEVQPDGTRVKNYYVPESVGIACGMLITALHNAGLATLTHTPSPMKFLNQICQRPDNEKAMMIVVTGYPADGAMVPKHAAEKKPLDEIASFF